MNPIDPVWAWSAFQPNTQRPWTLALAGHLFRRAGYGANWFRLQQALADGPQSTLDQLLKPAAGTAGFNRAYDDYEAAVAESNSTDELRAWWLRRMILTPYPLLERMTLFWHHHFATGNQGVSSAALMRQHVQKLRHGALGNFRELLAAMSLDPALLVWLGAAANRKALPSNHFAQQFLEAYTVGPGQFQQKDVHSLARSFTGWFVLQGQLRYIPREYDESDKEIFGQQGNFAPAQVVDLILEHPATAGLVVRRLYRWLISEREEPDQALLAPLVASFRKSYEILPLVETMLRSNLFFSPSAYRQRMKSPVDFALGLILGLEGTVATTPLGQDLAKLGQNLYHPPTPQGWIGGQYWINPVTLMGRHNLAMSLLLGSGPYGNGLRPWEVAKKYDRGTGASMTRFMLDLFLQGEVDTAIGETLQNKVKAGSQSDSLEATARRISHAIITLPEFQLS